MDPNSGRIYKKEDLTAEQLKDFIEVDEKDMTAKQKVTRQVSLNDRRSVLGQQLNDFKRKKKKKKLAKKSRQKNRK